MIRRLAVGLLLALWCGGAAAQTNLNPSSGQQIASPVLSGTLTGTYTLGGTPTITGPTITGNTTITGPVSYPASTGYAQATAAIAALQGAGL